MMEKASLAILLPILALGQSSAPDATPVTDPEPVNYVCGPNDEDARLATWDTALLCLFFDDMDPP